MHARGPAPQMTIDGRGRPVAEVLSVEADLFEKFPTDPAKLTALMRFAAHALDHPHPGPMSLTDLIDAIGADPEPWVLTDNPRNGLRATDAEVRAAGSDIAFTWAPRREYDTTDNSVIKAFLSSTSTVEQFRRRDWSFATNDEIAQATRIFPKLAMYEKAAR